jgi:hypothetical protein
MKWLLWLSVLIAMAGGIGVFTYFAATHNTPPSELPGFADGYEQGAWHTLLYYKATGRFPDRAWRERHMQSDLQTEADIEDSLDTANSRGSR